MNNRTERHEEFVVEYVRNGGNAHASGYLLRRIKK